MNLKRITWIVIILLEAAILTACGCSLAMAQVPSAPPYHGPVDKHLYFPVVNKGFNYSVTGQQLKDSLSGGDTTMLNGENLQKVTDRGSTTTNSITAKDLIIKDNTTGYNGSLLFQYDDGTSNIFQKNDDGHYIEMHNGAGATDGNPAGWRFVGQVSGQPATIDSNFVTLRQMQDSICGSSCVKNIANSDLVLDSTNEKRIRRIDLGNEYSDKAHVFKIWDNSAMHLPTFSDGDKPFFVWPYFAIGNNNVSPFDTTIDGIFMGTGYNYLGMSRHGRATTLVGDEVVNITANNGDESFADTLSIGNNTGMIFKDQTAKSQLKFYNHELTLNDIASGIPYYRFGHGVDMNAGGNITISTGGTSGPWPIAGSIQMKAFGGVRINGPNIGMGYYRFGLGVDMYSSGSNINIVSGSYADNFKNGGAVNIIGSHGISLKTDGTPISLSTKGLIAEGNLFLDNLEEDQEFYFPNESGTILLDADTTEVLATKTDLKHAAIDTERYAKYADTTAVLATKTDLKDAAIDTERYAKYADTTAVLATRHYVDGKIGDIDLSDYAKYADTTAVLATKTDLKHAAIDTERYAKYADTTAVLATRHYVDDKIGDIDLSDYAKYADTTAVLATRHYVDGKIGDIDLSDYAKYADTTAVLATKTDLKDAAIDTERYAKYADTASVLATKTDVSGVKTLYNSNPSISQDRTITANGNFTVYRPGGNQWIEMDDSGMFFQANVFHFFDNDATTGSDQQGSFDLSKLTGPQTYSFPDKSGTLSLSVSGTATIEQTGELKTYVIHDANLHPGATYYSIMPNADSDAAVMLHDNTYYITQQGNGDLQINFITAPEAGSYNIKWIAFY